MATLAVSFENVSYSYPSSGSLALSDISFSILPGELVVLLGANGSGKTTVAKLTNGILRPTSGAVKIFGKDAADPRNTLEIRQTVGLLFQNPDNQIVGLTVEEDVAFGPCNLGLPRDEVENRVRWALEKVGLLHLRKWDTNSLSGGQKQKVALAGLLAMRPKVLVLDEPTSMLDPLSRAEFIRTVFNLNRTEKTTVVFITHSVDEAVLFPRAIVLAGGKILYDGNTGELFLKREDIVKKANLEFPLALRISREIAKRAKRNFGPFLTEEELADAFFN